MDAALTTQGEEALGKLLPVRRPKTIALQDTPLIALC